MCIGNPEDLPEEILQEAIIALEDHGAVIGPSPDGGYYLIGFTQETFSPKTFEAVTWSTAKVFKETISKLKDQRQSIRILPKWSDVDALADLQGLIKILRKEINTAILRVKREAQRKIMFPKFPEHLILDYI